MYVSGKVGRLLPVGEDEDMAARLSCRCACALYIACSRAVVRCSSLHAGSAMEVSGKVVLVYGRAPKVASLG